VVLTSSIKTQNTSVTRRTPYLLRLWVYSRDSVRKFNVTNLLNIKVFSMGGWEVKKEIQARMTNRQSQNGDHAPIRD
jgi:hypothetical protein